MPQIIDIISPIVPATFTVDNTQDFVSTVNPGNLLAGNSSGKFIFEKGDSFRLLSAGIILKEQFTLYTESGDAVFPVVALTPRGVSTDFYENPNWQYGKQFFPIENHETVFDSFMLCKDSVNLADPTKTLLDENFALLFYLFSAIKISMNGVPADLNGVEFQVGMYAKILHNFPLS